MFEPLKNKQGFQMSESLVLIESGWRDSNSRPLAPHASALPGCATSRFVSVGYPTKSRSCWCMGTGHPFGDCKNKSFFEPLKENLAICQCSCQFARFLTGSHIPMALNISLNCLESPQSRPEFPSSRGEFH